MSCSLKTYLDTVKVNAKDENRTAQTSLAAPSPDNKTVRHTAVRWQQLVKEGNTGMRRITTFRSTTGRIYDGGPIIL